MTYCVAIALNKGLVFLSDSRTNAGVDQVSTYSKMHTFGVIGSRQFIMLSAGNLATTQAVVKQLERDIDNLAPVNLMTVPSIDEAADYVGQVSVEQQQKAAGTGTYEVSMILGGEIVGDKPGIRLIYPQGNHIAPPADSPFLQIGELKYGKPILDRIVAPDTPIQTAMLCGLVSMDSTMRSNVTVGPPIEILVYLVGSLAMNDRLKLEEDSEYLRELKRKWDQSLKDAFHRLPPPAWATAWDSANPESSTA